MTPGLMDDKIESPVLLHTACCETRRPDDPAVKIIKNNFQQQVFGTDPIFPVEFVFRF